MSNGQLDKLRMAALAADATHTIVELTVGGTTFNAIIGIDAASDEELRQGHWVKVIQPCGLRGCARQRDLIEEATL